MAVIAEAFREDCSLRVGEYTPDALGAGGYVMGTPQTHAVGVQLLRTVLQPVDAAFTCNKQSSPDGFEYLASCLNHFRIAEVHERHINTFFVSTLVAYQQHFRDFIAGLVCDPPTFGTCAPSALAAINENVDWMKRQRYDARQLEVAKEEASASRESSILLDFLANRAGDLHQRGTRRSPTERPDSADTKKKRAAADKVRPPYSREICIRLIVTRLSMRESDSEGKSQCCFFFGTQVTGQTCDRGEQCARSHDTTYWSVHGLTSAAVADAFSSDEAKLVACKGGWRRGWGPTPDARGYNTSWQDDRRPLRRPGRTRAQQEPLAGVRRRKEPRPSRGRLGLPTLSERRSQQQQQRGRQSRGKRPTKRRHERRRPQPRPQLVSQVTGRTRLAPPDRKSGGERGDQSGAAEGTRGSTTSQHLRR